MTTRQLRLAAIASGLATAVFIFAVFGTRSGAAAEPGDVRQATQVVVATTFIPAGTALTAEQLALRAAQPDLLAPGTVADIDSLVGRTTLAPIYRGEPVLRARVSGETTPAAALIEPGRTVFALPVAVGHAVGGIIAGGDHIAIIGSTSVRREEAPIVVIDDVVVLGTAGEFPFGGRRPTQGGTSNGLATSAPGQTSERILLLNVTLQQATQLAAMIENGRAYVALAGGQPSSGVAQARGGQ